MFKKGEAPEPYIIEQYYLLHELNSLITSTTQDIDWSRYEYVSIIGALEKVTRSQLDGVEVYLPTMVTGFSRYTLIIQHNDYRSSYAVTLGSVLNNPSSKNDIYCFTNLTPRILNDKLIYIIRSTSHLFLLEDRLPVANNSLRTAGLFNKLFSHFPSIFGCSYSLINCQQQSDRHYPSFAPKGIILDRIKNDPKIASQYRLICGLLETIDESATNSSHNQSKNKKQVRVMLYQHTQGQSLGCYKVFIKCFDSQQQKEVRAVIKNGYLYALVNPVQKVSESGEVWFVVQNFSKTDQTIVRLVSSAPWPIQTNYRQQHLLKVVPLDVLNIRAVDRNIHKFRVRMSHLNLMSISYICKKCGVVRTHNCDTGCRTSIHQGHLDIWSLITVLDSCNNSGTTAYLSLNTAESIQFLDLTEQILDEVTAYCIKKMQRINLSLKSQAQRTLVKQKNMLKLVSHLRRCYPQKVVTGIAYVDFRKTMKEGLTAEDRVSFESGLQSQRQFINLKEINPNGSFQRVKAGQNKKQDLKPVPAVKVRKVFSLLSQVHLI